MKEKLIDIVGAIALIPAAVAFSPKAIDSLDLSIQPTNVQGIEDVIDPVDGGENQKDLEITGGLVAINVLAWYLAKRNDDSSKGLERGLLWSFPAVVSATSALVAYDVWT